MEACITCKYAEPMDGNQGNCTVDPPRVFVTSAPGGVPGSVTRVSVYPVVPFPGFPCRFYRQQLVKEAKPVAGLELSK